MHNTINWMAVLVGTSLAVLWLSAAFMVAYPEYILTFKFGKLSIAFVNGERHENLYIPFLIMIDIIISLALKHYRTSNKALLTMFISGIVYIALAAFILQNIDSANDLSPLATNIVFTLSVLCLFIVRYMSFISAKDDSPPLAMIPVNAHMASLKGPNP